jgi:enoyl-[acyl-carrier protein] reductase/trans-2-enoyl-CoA reductase (NAD+)
MIVKPKIRGFICTTAHPAGCAQVIQEEIDDIRSQQPIENGPKKVLVIGASNGYGLSSRIVAAFGSGAATIGVFFERPAEGKRTATAGWYKAVAFERKAKEAGLYSRSFNGDAFSDEMKRTVVETIKKDLGEVDLVIYSLAAPRRVHPKTGQIFKSVLRPKGQPYTNKSIDFETETVDKVTLPAATQEDIDGTVAVMGGEDWQMWIHALKGAGALAKNAVTVAYSYIGPEITQAVYRNGTIGAAKDHLEASARLLDQELKEHGGRAFVSVNKALVTQSSSAIPFIPLYFVLLTKVMKRKGLNENCIQQMYRLFAERLYVGGDTPVDEAGRIRIDDLELRDDVQEDVNKLWEQVATDNVRQIADVEGYNQDFLRLFGFGIDGVDYEADVEVDLHLPEMITVANP